MIPGHILYVPTLGIRSSEMLAVEKSLVATKNNLKPCIILAPWYSSYNLENSIKRFEKAYPQRPYFLDIEKNYQSTNPDRHALIEMRGLFDPANGYKNWIDFIAAYQNVHPCIQCEGQNTAQIQQQIQAVKALGRAYCMRIDIQNFPKNIKDIIAAFKNETDYTVILEGGLVEEPLTLMSNFSGIISNQLSALKPDIPVVISCTSFPSDFGKMVGITDIIFTNRQLVSQLTGRKRIIYGDWGSTRPRQLDSGFFNRPLSRIDYPAKDSWHIARNKKAGWDYELAAQATINSLNWQGNLGIWGEDMIKQTAQNQALGIYSPIKNVASRVNIHIHRQAFYYKNDLTTIEVEDDYEDTV